MFRRSSSSSSDTGATALTAEEVAQGKGRPTRSRREAEQERQQRNRVPANRREAAAFERARRAEQRTATRAALMRGDEKSLPERDRGPVRRFVRDYVDNRRTPGEYFLYAAFAVVGLSLVPSAFLKSIGFLVMVALLVAVVVDGFALRRVLKRELPARFPGEDTKGAVLYGVVRSTQFRRLRLPAPQMEPRKRTPKSPATKA